MNEPPENNVYVGTVTDIKDGHKGRFVVIVSPPRFTEKDNVTLSTEETENPFWKGKPHRGMQVRFWGVYRKRTGWRAEYGCPVTP